MEKEVLFALLLSLIGMWVQVKNVRYIFPMMLQLDEYSVRSPNSSLRCQDMCMSPWHCTGLYFRLMLMAFNFRLTRPCLFDTKYRDRRFCVVDPTRLSYYIPANPMRSVGNMTTSYILYFTSFLETKRNCKDLESLYPRSRVLCKV